MSELKPWQLQPQESPKAYRYFCSYMEQLPGQRSIARLAKAVGKHVNTIEHLSMKYGWVARVRAWDVELASRLAASQGDAIVKMRKRHIQLGIGMQTAVVKELQALVHKIEKAAADAQAQAVKEGRDPSKAFHEPLLSAADIVKLSQHGVELERLTRGMATSHVETTGKEPDLSGLTLEEIKTLKALQTKIGS